MVLLALDIDPKQQRMVSPEKEKGKSFAAIDMKENIPEALAAVLLDRADDFVKDIDSKLVQKRLLR